MRYTTCMEDEDTDAHSFTSLGLQAFSVVKKLKKLAEVDREADNGACGQDDRSHRAADEKEGIVSVEQHQIPTKKDPDAEAPGLVREEDGLPGPSLTRTGENARS